MRVRGVQHRSIWVTEDLQSIAVIDQTALPHRFAIAHLRSLSDAVDAIRTMRVRGAPLIGITAAYGVALAARVDARDESLRAAARALCETRPTAVNLRWAVEQTVHALGNVPVENRAAAAMRFAGELADADVAACAAIGAAGHRVLADLWERKREGRLDILTHCNAGWLATVDFGTALAPIYAAHDAGIPVHVWVDETRPRNQGASLTAWELAQHGVAHTLIVDNSGGHLMQHDAVDACIVGADRITASGDACNKIGTYLKALAARDNDVPFYVAAPVSTIDFAMMDGVREIPIEKRDPGEILWVHGVDESGNAVRARIAPADTQAVNFGFDVTPARLITGIITERGVVPASNSGLRQLQAGA